MKKPDEFTSAFGKIRHLEHSLGLRKESRKELNSEIRMIRKS
jgi:hypothetical protein